MDTNGHEWDREDQDGFLCRMLGRVSRHVGLSPAACAKRMLDLLTTEATEAQRSPECSALNAAEQRRAFLEGLQGSEDTVSRIREACPTKNEKEEGSDR